jgi:hypothetical protein
VSWLATCNPVLIDSLFSIGTSSCELLFDWLDEEGDRKK